MKLVYILENNKCNECNLTIHPVFLGYHKCGYANCPICKNAITNSQYWPHIRSHPRHENDNSPLKKTFANRKYTNTRHASHSSNSKQPYNN